MFSSDCTVRLCAICERDRPNRMLQARGAQRLWLPRAAGGVGPEARLTKVWKRVGTGRQDMEAAGAGDIVSLTGAGTAAIADTIGGLDRAEALSPGPIEPPTLRRAAADTSRKAARAALPCGA